MLRTAEGPRSEAERKASLGLAAGRSLAPMHNLPYRLLARTCPKCGTFWTTPDALILKSSPQARCSTCDNARARARRLRNPSVGRQQQAKWRAAHPEAAAKLSRMVRDRVNDRLRGVAHRHRAEWTTADYEMAARDDLTAAQVAERIGRSLYAVRTMRRRMRIDPRLVGVTP